MILFFSKKIKGLITKFGGQNSHMSIRSSELSLPAAIGVGDEIYNSLKNKKYINLDCLNKKFTDENFDSTNNKRNIQKPNRILY